MQNASKPFGEKDTGLLSGPFHRARIRLTAFYVAILAVILFLSSGTTYSAFSDRLEHRFRRFHPAAGMLFPDGLVPPRAEEVRTDLVNSLIFVNSFLLFIAGILSYWLAGITLEPIQNAYDRQRRFLGDASHELRTPLSILQTDLENDLTAASSHAEKARATSHLEEVGRMSALVNDLLALSRLDDVDAAEAVTTVVRLRPLLEETVTRFAPLAQKQNVTLTLDLPDDDVSAVADPELLRRALDNVVKNAVTYNVRDGSVIIRAAHEKNGTQLTVTDTGIGIEAKDLATVFERFTRTDQSRTRETGGSGLGLSITRSAMERMGGSIAIDSTPNAGTTVTLSLRRS